MADVHMASPPESLSETPPDVDMASDDSPHEEDMPPEDDHFLCEALAKFEFESSPQSSTITEKCDDSSGRCPQSSTITEKCDDSSGRCNTISGSTNIATPNSQKTGRQSSTTGGKRKYMRKRHGSRLRRPVSASKENILHFRARKGSFEVAFPTHSKSAKELFPLAETASPQGLPKLGQISIQDLPNNSQRSTQLPTNSQNSSQNSQEVSQESVLFMEWAETMGTQWQDVAIALNFEMPKIESILADHRDTITQAVNMLMTYSQKVGESSRGREHIEKAMTDNHLPLSKDFPISTKELNEVAKQIPLTWRNVAAKLGVPSHETDAFYVNNTNNVTLAALKMLCKWRNICTIAGRNRAEMVQALQKAVEGFHVQCLM